MKNIIFLHGFLSAANGRKSQYIAPRIAALPDVTFHAFAFSPELIDFEHLTVTGMINRLRQYVLANGLRDVSLIGSSMGGLVALNYANMYGGVERLLLLSPALIYYSKARVGLPIEQWRERGSGELFHYGFNRTVKLRATLDKDGRLYQTSPSPPVPIHIIHGSQDTIAPVEDSRRYVAHYPQQTELTEVEAEHNIDDHLDVVWEVVEQFLLGER